ncbi:hypothetical protein ACFWY5_29610 [Nonomuraea sp. NPDC059007]|uniref:toprim domain-containing protein n=1 Tax=Nonomuraea sp. NPDC059007 TaxID=3346692 RepID=UPI0036A1C27D
MESSSRKYHEALEGSPAEEYLVGRGLTREVIQHFRLGYVESPSANHEKYRGCLAIPYLTPDGSVTSIRFRNLAGTGTKYLTVPGDMPRLYNAADLVPAYPRICTTEGELDACVAKMAGLPVVGLPGANAWRKEWRYVFRQYDIVYHLADDDEAGQKMGEQLQTELDNVRVITMTGGDVNTYWLEHGSQGLKDRVNGKR